MAIDFFKTTGDLRKYISNVDASVNISSFESYMRPVRERMLNTIGASTYSTLKTYYNDSYPGGDTKKDTAVEYIQGAMANFIARAHSIFDAKGPEEEGRKYRYQEEKILELYLENAWTEMNNLIEYLEANADVFTAFSLTDKYKERQTLFIKSAHQFNKGYPINNSAYFYNNIIYILKEVQLDISSRIANFPDTLSEIDEATQWYILKALTFETMSRACKRMDYTELPRGIRQDAMKEVNNKARLNTYAEDYIRVTLFNYLHENAQYWMEKIEIEANKDRNDGDYIEPVDDDPIDEDDKFFIPGL
jgi:hypothetical protein